MLTEKFRPSSFNDVICRDAIINDLKRMIASPDGIPHILFYGIQGSGKTTLAHVIANEIYGSMKGNFFHEINASSDRGIDIIRDKVTDLCKVKPMGFPYKIIFMDEADYLTAEAQACFRRLIETYHKTVRFIFSCNQVYKLIPPILSRFVKYEVSSIDIKTLAQHLKKITKLEGITKFDDKTLVQFAKKSNGDIRAAINSLEGSSTQENDVWDSITFNGLLSMPKQERIKLAFSGDPDMIFSKVWEMVQQSEAWQNLDLMASTQSNMNYAAIKNVFVAKMLEGLK